MRRVFTFLAIATLALTVVQHEARACGPAESAQAAGFRAGMGKLMEQGKYDAAEAFYGKILALSSTCARPEDHRRAATIARWHGDIATALVRHRLAGDDAAVAQANRAYGGIRINAATLPGPRVLTWPGFRNFGNEERTVVNRAKDGFSPDGVYEGYLPPGEYILSAGFNPNHVEIRFEVKAGETKVVNYP